MKQVILTVGLSGSGKTTAMYEMMDADPGKYKLVCKDDIRAMLDNSKWTGPNEKFVLKVRDTIILMALEEGKHVIVADTNLNPIHRKHIEELVKGIAEVIIVDFTYVSVEECIKRDLKRLNSVGEKVIRDQYKKWLAVKSEPPKYDPKLPDAIIVDIDGTLALHNGRNPFDHTKVEEDLLNKPVYEAISSMQIDLDESHVDGGKQFHTLLVSGRDSVARLATERWLETNEVLYSRLWMRPEGDKRKDVIIKEEIYAREIEGKYNIICVFDDRNQVVDFWRSKGLICFQVAEGDF